VSVLSDRHLACLYPGSNPGPSSIDVHLGDEILGLASGIVLDPEIDQSDAWTPLQTCSDGRWRLDRLHPYLGVTRERLTISERHVGLLHGISSLGRLFLLIHVTAGLVDAGWTRSRLTLELMPLAAPILLRPGQRIGQITLHEMTSACVKPYGHPDRHSKYQGDREAVPSRMFQEVLSHA
jgi:dCTP deaminase